MSVRVFAAVLAAIAIAGLVVGRYVLAPRHAAATPAATTSMPATVATPEVAPIPDRGPRSARSGAAPRFTPPPIPNDPGLASWLASGSSIPTPEMIASANKMIATRLDELFGADFPAEKRAKVLAAQEAAMRRSSQFTWDYYHGDIDNDAFASELHQTVLTYGHDIEVALDRDEYREFMGVDVGTDPYSVIATPGLRPGDLLPKGGGVPSSPAP